MRFLAGFVAAIVASTFIAFLIVVSGTYNVAATVPQCLSEEKLSRMSRL